MFGTSRSWTNKIELFEEHLDHREYHARLTVTMSQVTGTVSSSFMDTTLTPKTVGADNQELKTFSYTDYKCQDMEEDVDPDNNFFNDIVDNCCYYSTDQNNRTVKK